MKIVNPGMKIFPVAFGHEHETGQISGEIGNLFENDNFASNLDRYVPAQYKLTDQFLKTGFRVYPGGSCLEICTPECGSPKELAKYIHAGRIIVAETFENFLSSMSGKTDSVIEGRIHERVVDSIGNRKGSHYNIGINNEDEFPIDEEVILSHQATRQFVTGSGYAGPRGLRYSQKIGGLSYVRRYDFIGSMIRTTDDEGTRRIEDRCADINMSEWATWMHVGSLAMAVTISRTPLKDELPSIKIGNHPITEIAKFLNVVRIDNDGVLIPNERSWIAVDFQQKMAELFMDKVIFYADELPEDYYIIARELYKTCENFRHFISGEVTFDEFAFNHDWAAKFSVLRRNINKDRSFGILRRDTDSKSMATDMLYDATRYKFYEGQEISKVPGLANKLKNRNLLSRMFSENDLIQALVKPPASTRAVMRSHLIENYRHYITSVEWDRVCLEDKHKRPYVFEMPEVDQANFSSTDHIKLDTLDQST
ncbi:MAG: proteasome accessory factor PafA2 family protein [Candidatus Saccharimonadales bacterium]